MPCSFGLLPHPRSAACAPVQPPSPSDRECPLHTARDRCLWHVGGAAGENDHLARGGNGSQLGQKVSPSSVTTASWARARRAPGSWAKRLKVHVACLRYPRSESIVQDLRRLPC
jgi:hypothetical protein